jgi:hypothetical protein
MKTYHLQQGLQASNARSTHAQETSSDPETSHKLSDTLVSVAFGAAHHGGQRETRIGAESSLQRECSMNNVNRIETEESDTAKLDESLLSPAESARLAELEPIIESGLKNVFEVGKALREIRDERLYRQTHSTFAEYVEDRWKMSVRQAYRLIEATETVNGLPAQCAQLVTNESQARELTKIEPENRAEVLKAVSENGKVTAKAIYTEARKRKETLIAKIEMAIFKAPKMTEEQASIFDTFGVASEYVVSAAQGAGLDKISIVVGGSELKIWNTKEHLGACLASLKRMSVSSNLKAKPGDGSPKRDYGRMLTREDRRAIECVKWWKEASETERGEFLPDVFSKPVMVPDKAELRGCLEHWFAELVEEAEL